MTHPANLKEIVENGLCAGCGLCESLAGRDRVRMTWVDPPGRLRPAILEELDPETEQSILRSCPGALLDEPCDPIRHGPDVREDTCFGPWIRVWKGFAADQEIQHRAASGGALTALAIHMLESGKVDLICHVKADKNRPMRSTSHVSYNRDDVLDASGSRYGPVAPLDRFHEILDMNRPFAVIGKPCDISGVHNMRKIDTRVNELVRYTLAFSCGTFADLDSSRQMLERTGFPGGKDGEDNLTVYRYRGYGCPGPTRAIDTDGRIYDERYLDFWYGPHGWTHQFRCRICADPTGEATDVSVADAWPGGAPVIDEWGGYNTFVSRTVVGNDLMVDAIEAGVLKVEEHDIDIMYDVQPHQVEKKQGLNARLDAMESFGSILPDFRNVRLDAAAAQQSPSFHEENRSGMVERLQNGIAREPLPEAKTR